MAKLSTRDPRFLVFQALWERAMADPMVFHFGDAKQRGLVVTQDEHDLTNPLKPLPDRPHLRALLRLWDEAQQLAVGKSRQMMVSWLFGSRVLYDALHPGTRWLVTCRKFEDADTLLERMWGVYERIPVPAGVKPKATRKQGLIVVQHGQVQSRIQAAAQDTDAPRSQTFTGIWVDEAAYTDSLSSLYAAAKPTVMGGGKIVLSTTPNGRDFFWSLLSDNGRLSL